MTTPKILLVIDDAIVAEQATIALQRLGYSVVLAGLDCDIAQEVEVHVPHIVLWDTTNTRNDAEILRERRISYAVDIPIVPLSAVFMPTTILQQVGQEGIGEDAFAALHDTELRAGIEGIIEEHQLRCKEREQASVLYAALSVITDAVIHVDTQGYIRFFNAAAECVTGEKSTDVIGRQCAEVVSLRHTNKPDGLVFALPRNAVERSQLPDDIWLYKHDNMCIPVQGTIAPVGEQHNGVLLVFRDVSEGYFREKVEHEMRFDDIYDSSPIIMQLIDENGIIRNVNRRWLEVLEYAQEEVVGRSIFSLMVPDAIPRVQDIFLSQLWQQGQLYNIACQFAKKNGDVADVLIDCKVYGNPEHGRIGLMVLQDVSEQKRAEQALVHNQRKYHDLIRNVPIAIMRFLVKENRYEFVNNEFERQSGYTLEEVEQLRDDDLIAMIHPEDQLHVFTCFRDWQQQGYHKAQRLTYRILNKKGHVVWLDSYMYSDYDDEGEAVAINQICVDISDLKKAEIALNDTLREDFRRTVQNLQNLVFKLYLLPNGDYAYSLREGKLAGEYTTNIVRGQRPADIYGKEHDLLVRSYILRAFEGEPMSFTLELGGKWFVYLLEPIVEDGKVAEVVGSAVDITYQKNTERRLLDSERKFRVLVENLPIAIVHNIVQEDGSIQPQYVNPEYERRVGYTLEKNLLITREQVASLYHPDDREWVEANWNNWIRSTSDNNTLHQIFRFQNQAGEYRWFDNYAIKYATDDGATSVIEAVLDVTEQKINDEHLRRLASFPEQDPNPIVETDLKGNILYVNPTAQIVFPDILEKQKEHPVLEWVWGKMEALLEQPGEVLSREISMDGEVYEQAVFYLPEVQLLRIFCYRITERKRAEEQLRKALVKERELSSLKTRFVSTVSHEFRTPLTGILMSADIMARYGSRLSEEERIQEVDKIKKRVNELTDLMNDFLLQSSAESMGNTFKPIAVDIGKLCENIVRDYLLVASSSSVVLHCDIASNVLPVMGDPKLLRLVIQNLISNAVKYSLHRTPVTVQVRNDGGKVILTVIDKGIGIPDDELPRLFTPFHRASNTAKIPGTGIGLSIVKEFVELHNGTIHVESGTGRGSVFTVSLPAVKKT